MRIGQSFEFELEWGLYAQSAGSHVFHLFLFVSAFRDGHWCVKYEDERIKANLFKWTLRYDLDEEARGFQFTWRFNGQHFHINE